MAGIGSKAFTTELIRIVTEAVFSRLGDGAYVRRFTGEVASVDETENTCEIYIMGQTTASGGFRIRGLQTPEVGDIVQVCIDKQQRWIESVFRKPGTVTIGGSGFKGASMLLDTSVTNVADENNPLRYDEVEYDVGGYADSTQNHFVIPVGEDGIYRITMHTTIQSDSATSPFTMSGWVLRDTA